MNLKMLTLGFVGTGAITAAIVRGLKNSDLRDWQIILSPRSAALSAELARSFPGVSVASSNQSVVNESEIVFLAVRPQDAPIAIPELTFSKSQSIISLVAALTSDTIQSWTGVHEITRAVPLTFVEQRTGVTPIMPPNARTAEIFNALGDCIQVTESKEFDAYAAAGSLMEMYFGIIEVARDRLIAAGLNAADTELFLRNLFGNLGDVLRQRPLTLGELRAAHTTRGGLNELAYKTYIESGGGTAVADAISAVIRRIESFSSTSA